jgi:hypothetical protein
MGSGSQPTFLTACPSALGNDISGFKSRGTCIGDGLVLTPAHAADPDGADDRCTILKWHSFSEGHNTPVI